jgi:hypothetical protein
VRIMLKVDRMLSDVSRCHFDSRSSSGPPRAYSPSNMSALFLSPSIHLAFEVFRQGGGKDFCVRGDVCK